MNRLDHIYWNHVAGTAYRRADLLIAVSDYVADGLKDHLKIAEDRVVTINNGVDPRFRKLAADEIDQSRWDEHGIEGPYMLCVGNLVPVKNFETAIRAYSLCARDGQELPQLVLAGGHQHAHYTDLRNLVAKEGLDASVKFVGYQSGEDLLHFYNGAKMLIHPSLHEGFSFTILEAMACGVPIIGSDSTSIPEAAGNAALYHAPTDVEALADRMKQLLDDDQLREKLSAAALARSPEFTWKKCVTKTVEAYDRLT